MDPFAVALGALFRAPGSIAAVYFPAGGEPVELRAIRSQPDRVARFGGMQVALSSESFEVLRLDVARPAIGDTIRAGTFSSVGDTDPLFTIVADPIGDVEGLGWTCWAEPVA